RASTTSRQSCAASARTTARPSPRDAPVTIPTPEVIGLKIQVQVSFKSSRMSELLTISEISRRSGVASSALRFYEQRGLITSERAGSGHRRYPRAVLRRIAFIVFAQRVGLTLDEIGDELEKLPPHRAPTRRDWSRLSAMWRSRIDERILELERLRRGATGGRRGGCLP